MTRLRNLLRLCYKKNREIGKPSIATFETCNCFHTNSFHRPSAAKALTHRWLQNQLGFQRTPVLSSSISHANVRTGEFANYLAVKKLKKAALGYIASNLTQTEVATLRELFQSMDKNSVGFISLTEIDEAIAKGRFSERVLHDLRQIRGDLAISGDQQIDWRDFAASTMDRSVALRDDNMRMAFEHFRHSNAEFVTIEDLADIFGGKAHAQEVMDVLDADGDGKVSYEDFRSAIVESMATDDVESDEIIY